MGLSICYLIAFSHSILMFWKLNTRHLTILLPPLGGKMINFGVHAT